MDAPKSQITQESVENAGSISNAVGITREAATDDKLKKDDELLILSTQWLEEATPLFRKMRKEQKRNERYYVGDQIAVDKLDEFDSKVVTNKIFQSTETIIPIATKRLPAPTVTLPPKDDPSEDIDYNRYANEMEEVILAVAEENNLSLQSKEFLREFLINYLACFKFGYDADDGEIWVRTIRADRLLVPPNTSGEYVIEFREDTAQDIIDNLGKDNPEVEKKVKTYLEKSKNKSSLGTVLSYHEFTTTKYKFWRLGSEILHKIENPYYDFKNKKNNHWRKPQMDYIFSDLWTLNKTPYAQFTLISQSISLQDIVNKRKRQIADNATSGQGVLVGYGKMGVTKSEIAELKRARKQNEAAFLENAETGAIQQFSPQSIAEFVYTDMLHSIGEIDNLFGTHSVTRGEKTPGEETFGGRQLLKESDSERIQELSEMMERVIEKLYNAFAQIIVMFFDEEQYLPYIGADGTARQVKIHRKVIREGVNIKVRQGTSLVKDKATLSSEAIRLAQLKLMDPVTLYERLNDPHPYKTAERLFLYSNFPDKMFKRVAAEYAMATEADREKEIIVSVHMAELENKALMEGQTVVPYENPTPQHIATHLQTFESPEFMQLPLEIRQKAADLLEAELKVHTKQNQEFKSSQPAQPQATAQPPLPVGQPEMAPPEMMSPEGPMGGIQG